MKHNTTDKKEFDRVLGARLRQLRKINGITQQSVGDAIGTTFQQVQKYESGKNAIKAGVLLRIMKHIGAGFYEVFDDTSLPRPNALPSHQQQMISAFNKLSAAQQKNCVAVITSMRPAQSTQPNAKD